MAQPDGTTRNVETPRTVEQLLHSDSRNTWNAPPSAFGQLLDQEEDHLHRGKKLSVLAKVKEKARKWRQTLVKKKHGHHDDDNHTPKWGVALEDYEVEDDHHHEYHGPPTYESDHAPENYRVKGRLVPRVDPMISEQHVPSSNINRQFDFQGMEKPLTMKVTTLPALARSHSNPHRGKSSTPTKTIDLRSKSVRDHRQQNPTPRFAKDGPLARIDSDDKRKMKVQLTEPATEVVASSTYIVEDKGQPSKVKTASDHAEIEEIVEKATITERSSVSEEKEKFYDPCGALEQKPVSRRRMTKTRSCDFEEALEEEQPPTTKKTITETVSEKLGPAYATVSEATQKITSKFQGLSIGSLTFPSTKNRNWDKGVSVKEYLRNKLEPGEDERALSQVISEAMSPRRSPSDRGVVEKVKEAVTLLLQSEESSPSSMKNSDSSSNIPVSTNAHEVEEENQGKVLQTN